MTRVASRALSRRTALRGVIGGVAAGAALLAGCTVPERVRRPLTAAPASTAPPGPDVLLVAEALDEERAVLALLTAVGARHRGLRGTVAAADEIHQAHLRLLSRAVPPGASTGPTGPTGDASAGQTVRSPRHRSAAVAALAGAEGDLARAGRGRAGRAESGALARVLASMSAASVQQERAWQQQATQGAS